MTLKTSRTPVFRAGGSRLWVQDEVSMWLEPKWGFRIDRGLSDLTYTSCFGVLLF